MVVATMVIMVMIRTRRRRRRDVVVLRAIGRMNDMKRVVVVAVIRPAGTEHHIAQRYEHTHIAGVCLGGGAEANAAPASRERGRIAGSPRFRRNIGVVQASDIEGESWRNCMRQSSIAAEPAAGLNFQFGDGVRDARGIIGTPHAWVVFGHGMFHFMGPGDGVGHVHTPATQRQHRFDV